MKLLLLLLAGSYNLTMRLSNDRNCTVFTRNCFDILYSTMMPMKRICGYGMCMWFVIGVFGNILSAIVWTSRRMRKENSSAIYLAALSITDLLTLILTLIIQLSFFFNINTYFYPIICETIFIPQLSVMHLSTMLVLAFTVERWLAICFPFHRDSLCTPRRAVIVVVMLTIFSICVFSPYSYFLFYDSNTGICEVRNAHIYFYYQSTLEIVFSAGVPICTLVFNLLVIRELQKMAARSHAIGNGASGGGAGGDGANDSRNFKSTTAMLLSVSFFLILTALPEGATFSLQTFFPEGGDGLTLVEVQNDHVWVRHFRYLNVKLMTGFIGQSHYACNFIIYLCTGRLYRTYVMRLFGLDRCLRIQGLHDGDEYRHKYSTIDGSGVDRGTCRYGEPVTQDVNYNEDGNSGINPSSSAMRRERRQKFVPATNPRRSQSRAVNNRQVPTVQTYV